MKKLLFFIVSVVVITMSVTPAFASGSHHGGIRRTVSYSVCAVKNCSQTGLHTHNGQAYTSHYYNDGHTYHSYCNLENCDLTGYHAHDGVYCFSHAAGDGHSYHHTGGGHH